MVSKIASKSVHVHLPLVANDVRIAIVVIISCGFTRGNAQNFYSIHLLKNEAVAGLGMTGLEASKLMLAY